MKFSKYNNPNKRRKSRTHLDPVVVTKMVCDERQYLKDTFGIEHSDEYWNNKYLSMLKKEDI